MTRLVSAIALCVSSAAWAADGANPNTEAANGDFASSLSAYLHAITGWNGERSKLEQAGLTFTFTY